MNILHRTVDFLDIKASGESKGQIEGYGAVFGNVDSYGDVIQKGAFGVTLREWKAKGKFPQMLLQHGGYGVTNTDLLPIGKWTDMKEDDHGLWVKGQLFSLDTELGSRVYEAMVSGELDSLSIGYQPVKWISGDGEKNPYRTLVEVKLWEISPVTFPANAQALITAVKGMGVRDIEGLLRDEGMSRSAAEMAARVLMKYLPRDEVRPEIAPRDEVAPEQKEVLEALARLTDSTWESVFRN